MRSRAGRLLPKNDAERPLPSVSIILIIIMIINDIVFYIIAIS